MKDCLVENMNLTAQLTELVPSFRPSPPTGEKVAEGRMRRPCPANLRCCHDFYSAMKGEKSSAVAVLIAVVLLLPGLSQARYLNTANGRFQTMDTFAGDQEEPQTLHKYAYAGNDPVGNSDPSGKSFFAFDGTGNTPKEKDGGVVSPTNVRKMYEASLDPHPHYEIGVGTGIPGLSLPGQAFGAGMSRRIKQAMGELEADRNLNDRQVDIVGFSRGGIEAIEFANRIADKYPDEVIRFVGLYDPVGSVGHPGGFGGYRFTLPDNVVHSVEAFAQDENRRMFPGTDANAEVWQWFRGVHSDIGGGFKNHDIADGVLQWMTDQAHSAGVSMDLNLIKKYGWNPNLNGQINRNHGFTSWFTRKGGRYVISDVGAYTYDGFY